jgi:hypothetical protein
MGNRMMRNFTICNFHQITDALNQGRKKGRTQACVARKGGGGARETLVGKPEGKIPVGKLRRR